MNELFYRPSSLFSTEAVLIEALRRRSESEISKRDELIAEYQKRLALRDAAQRSLEAAPKPALPEATADSRRSLADAAQTAAPSEPPGLSEAEARLQSLGEAAALDALVAQRLARGLEDLADILASGELQEAQDRADSLRRDPALRSRPDSRLEAASHKLLTSLSAGIAGLLSAQEGGAAPRADDLATLERFRGELSSLGGQLATAREESAKLRGSLAQTQAERDRAATDLAAARASLASLETRAAGLRDRIALAEPQTRFAATPDATTGSTDPGRLPAETSTPALLAASPPASIASPEADLSAEPRSGATSPKPMPAAISGPTVAAAIPHSAPVPANAASQPRGAFLGSVAAILGSRLLVDLTEGTRVQAGQSVAVYAKEGGTFVLRASGLVLSARQGTATISLDAPTLATLDAAGTSAAAAAGPTALPPINLQDPVFLLP